jgi:membrane protein required for beta-lactamase induction
VHKVTAKNPVLVKILLLMYWSDVHRVMVATAPLGTVDGVAIAWMDFVARVMSSKYYYVARPTFDYYYGVLSCGL